MRRLIVLAITAALLCALPAASGTAGGAGPVGAAAAKKKCTSQQHRKHRRRCFRPGQGAAGEGSDSNAAGDSCPNTVSSPGRLAARESEYTIVLSRPSVNCRTVIVEQDNLGEDPHDLVLQKAGNAAPSYSFGELGPGGVAPRTLDLGRGTWTLYCSLPGHYDLGMHANLEVD
jgi:hypothetical protein